MLTLLRCFLGSIGCLLLALSPVRAHPVSLSSAIVNIEERQLQVELQIMLEDLVLYHALKADERNLYSSQDLLTAAHKHRQFVLDYFSVLDGDGRRLTGTIQQESFEQIDLYRASARKRCAGN